MNRDRTISTEKKLRLIRTLRSEDEANRGLLRSREEILYGRGFSYAPGYDSVGEENPPDSVRFASFKLRLFAAVLLLAAFISWDMGYYPIPGAQPDRVYEAVSAESGITNLFDFTDYIPYTLN